VYSKISIASLDILLPLLSYSCNSARVASTINPTIHNHTSGGGNIELIAAVVSIQTPLGQDLSLSVMHSYKNYIARAIGPSHSQHPVCT
jgi:hypothetical protein